MKTVILLILFLCVVPAVVFGFGQQEERMDEAKQLFLEKEYDKAMAVFTEVWRTDPEKKQEVQAYLDEIMRRERRMNEIKEEIKTELYDNKNIEATVLLIDELRDIDPNVEDFIKEIDKGIRVVYNFNLFNKIMDEALVLLTAGKYDDAVKKYYEAFELHREEFYENSAYGNIIQSAVRLFIQQTQQQMAAYVAQAEKAGTASAKLTTQLSSSAWDAALKQVAVVHAEYMRLLDYRAQVKDLGQKIIEQNEQIKKTTGSGRGDNFLFYVYQTILGRINKDTEEGLFFVIEKHWEQMQNREEPDIRKAADSLYVQAKQVLNTNNGERIKILFSQAEKLYAAGADIVFEYARLVDGPSPVDLNTAENERVKLKYPLYVYYISRAEESKIYPRLFARRETFNTLKTTFNALNDIKDLKKLSALRLSIQTETDALFSEKNIWLQREKIFEAMPETEVLMQASLVSAKEVTAYVNALLTDYAKLMKDNAVKIASLEYAPLLTELEDKEKRFEQGVALRDIPGVDNGNFKYPTRAIGLYKSLITEIGDFDKKLVDFRTNWEKEDETVQSQPEIQKLLSDVELLQARVDALKAKLGPEIKATQAQQLDAQQRRDKGLDEYNRAKAFAARNDFKNARGRADEATVALRDSLLYEEDAGIRSILEKELPEFSSESVIAWRNKIIDDVRNAINQSERFTNNTQFNEAEQVLLQAENSWKQLDEGENTEITVALERVRFAKEYTNSRFIESTHPMYGNVTSWLNLANQYYNEGLSLLKQSKTEDAKDKFNQALENIRNIRKDFPYHEESSILELKIFKETETKPVFDLRFKTEFDRVNGKTDAPALATLENLYAINPKYPGLEAAREKALIANRIKVAAVSPQAIQNSNILTDRAQGLIRTPSLDNYKTAQNLLNQALTINPKNTRAQQLIDQVNKALTPYGKDLTPADRQILVQVDAAYKAGNRPLAAQLLRPLVAKYPANTEVLRYKGLLGL
ncbi:MAG: hypothetical protein JW904_03810 [Spirochaetales bacterium]|nr:hypothetical protein [Spirochaetales bacterium]